VGLAEGVLAGDGRAVAKALTRVERGGAGAEALMAALGGASGRAWSVGVTGAPGVGKSSLAQVLGLELMCPAERLAVLAVDPSSPFSGGALLGDRVRMPDLLQAGAFVRSMATRGALGGLAAATADAVDVLDAAGFGWVLVETVGVGQDEVDVAETVDTVVVITVAGMGDDIQAAKAGILEVADIYVVNKADRPGAEVQVAALEGMLELQDAQEWRAPIVLTSATTREGVGDLARAVADHRQFLEHGGRRETRRRRRVAGRLERLVRGLAAQRLHAALAGELSAVVREVEEGIIDVHSGARRLAARLLAEEK
jgi:LAO/AO transport system kinase